MLGHLRSNLLFVQIVNIGQEDRDVEQVDDPIYFDVKDLGVIATVLVMLPTYG